MMRPATQTRMMEGIIVYVVLMFYVTTCIACPLHCSCSTIDNGTSVVCKGTNYTQFPDDFPKDTIYLKFTHTNLTILTKDNFTRLINLQILILSFGKLKYIANDTFNDIRQLRRLDLSYNRFNPVDMLWMATCGTDKLQKLETLNLGNTRMGLSQLEIFIDCLQNQVSLQDLYLSGNAFRSIPNYLFSKLPGLQQLDLSQTKLLEPLNVLAFVNLTSLKRLHLDLNYLRTFPNFTTQGVRHGSILPSLEFIKLDFNNLLQLPDQDVGLKQLLYLNAAHNHFSMLNHLLIGTVVPSLKTLMLENNGIQTRKIVLNSTQLTILNLSYNKLDFNDNGDMFRYVPNLRILHLDGNDLSAVWRPIIGNALFKNNHKLVYVSMSAARIAQLPVDIFWNLPQLVKLYMFDNAIAYLDPKLFEKSLGLRKLDLRNNRISAISENTFPAQVLENLVMLELADNPYQCDCSLVWFADWLNRTSAVIGQTTHYKCLTPPEQKGKHLLQFHMPPELCEQHEKNLAYVLSVSLSISLSFILAISVVIYKFRWHIGYVYFLLQSRRRKYRALHDDTEYRYDAFIVYNRNDVQWLLNDMLPKLEVEYEFKLCIHDRDWEAGGDIYDNIIESISSSRKTILLVSNAFATSEWCHFEMTMAQSRLFADDRNALIMVLLEDLRPENITPRLAMQMKRQTFVMWTDNEMGRKLFWKKLHRALRRAVDSVMYGRN